MGKKQMQFEVCSQTLQEKCKMKSTESVAKIIAEMIQNKMKGIDFTNIKEFESITINLV